MKKNLTILLVGILAMFTLLYGAGTTINGARTILNALTIGTDNSAAGTLQIANGSANAHTIFSSGATTSNTIAGFTAVPVTGHIVTCTSSGTTCTLTDGGAPASGSGLVLVEQHTASTSASLDFTTCISATYDEYQIELLNVVPATDNVQLLFRASTNGGSSYDAGTNYGWAGFRFAFNGSATDGASTGQTSVVVSANGNVDGSTAYGVSGHLRLFSPSSTSVNKQITGQLTFLDNGNNIVEVNVSGAYISTTAVNAFQFLTSSGNLASGIIRCYGVAKS